MKSTVLFSHFGNSERRMQTWEALIERVNTRNRRKVIHRRRRPPYVAGVRKLGGTQYKKPAGSAQWSTPGPPGAQSAHQDSSDSKARVLEPKTKPANLSSISNGILVSGRLRQTGHSRKIPAHPVRARKIGSPISGICLGMQLRRFLSNMLKTFVHCGNTQQHGIRRDTPATPSSTKNFCRDCWYLLRIWRSPMRLALTPPTESRLLEANFMKAARFSRRHRRE